MSVPQPFASKVFHAWHNDVPDWVSELASLADQSGLKGAGERISYSASAVSSVLSNAYKGDLPRVEQAVRGALMGLIVNCPVLGELPRNQCLDWQKSPFSTSDSMRVRVFRACRRGCLHSRISTKGDLS